MTWFADTASWALILGVLSPLLISVVEQPHWSARTRAIIGAVAAVAIGALTVAANGGFTDTTNVLGVIALVMVASNSAYQHLWKPTGVSPKIEAATSNTQGKHEAGTPVDTALPPEDPPPPPPPPVAPPYDPGGPRPA